MVMIHLPGQNCNLILCPIHDFTVSLFRHALRLSLTSIRNPALNYNSGMGTQSNNY